MAGVTGKNSLFKSKAQTHDDVAYKSTPKKNTKAAFAIKKLEKIVKEPDIAWYMKANKKLQACAKMQASMQSLLGLIFIACTDNMYRAMFGGRPCPVVSMPLPIPETEMATIEVERNQIKFK